MTPAIEEPSTVERDWLGDRLVLTSTELGMYLSAMVELSSGTVTFLLTDVEGSTRLWESDAAEMPLAMERHDAIIEGRVACRGGVVIKARGEGDSRFAVFPNAADAVAAAVAIQSDLAGEMWPTSTSVRVRIGLHTGYALLRDGDFYGSVINRCARIRSLGHGGQTLLSKSGGRPRNPADTGRCGGSRS